MSQLDKYIDDKSQDKSVPNKSSVVLKIQADGKKILLTGDVTPDRLELILGKLSKENNNEPVEFDYVKLPHHGSYRSMSKKIIEKLKCKNFIISTNSKKYYLPNKRTLLKVLKFSDRTDNQPINFIFNYEESITNLEISKKEKIDYNFKLTPNNKSYGFSF
jgi:beta-lactamase superfamily II metal-dependent hydrolase